MRRGRVTQTGEVTVMPCHQTDLNPTSPPFRPPTKKEVTALEVTLLSGCWERLVTHYSRATIQLPPASRKPGFPCTRCGLSRSEAKGQSSEQLKETGVTGSPMELATSPVGLNSWVLLPSNPASSFSAGVSGPDLVQSQLQRAASLMHLLPDTSRAESGGNVPFQCIRKSLSPQASSPSFTSSAS